MRFLLDTHTFIWFVTGHNRLSTKARQLIEISDNRRFVSMVTLWEIAIKMSLGKLTIGGNFKQLVPQQLIENDMQLLPIEVFHLHQLVQLPFHHRDPFDRLLVAQSIVENLPLISRDSIFDSYPVQRLWS